MRAATNEQLSFATNPAEQPTAEQSRFGGFYAFRHNADRHSAGALLRLADKASQQSRSGDWLPGIWISRRTFCNQTQNRLTR